MIAIPDLEVTGDEASQLRLATAYNFPAVLASAGQQQWPQLRPAHAKLLQDRDPAIRRTLACSLHEVAALLGPDRALADLGPAIQVCVCVHVCVCLGVSASVWVCVFVCVSVSVSVCVIWHCTHNYSCLPASMLHCQIHLPSYTSLVSRIL